MPEVIKFSKGTVAEHNNFTGENGEITLICDDSPNRKVTGVIRLHDGQTVGGIPFGGSQLLNDLHDVNAANTIANQILTVNANGEFYFANTVETIADGTISGDKIHGGTISDSVLKLKSSGDSIIASDGITGILSESNGIVMLTANGMVSTNENDVSAIFRRNGTSGRLLDFRYADSGVVGSIEVSLSGTTYNTTSDRRLKTDIQPITNGTDKLMAMNPVTHKWKADPDAPAVHGFIAQEMQNVIPEAVSGDPDGEEMMSMDYGRITPILVAALQDAHREIQKLKAEIVALKGDN